MKNQVEENPVRRRAHESRRFMAAQSPAQTILLGLSRLIEGQCSFAENFGLSMEAIFPRVADSFQDRETAQVLKAWLSGHEEGVHKLQMLMEDLIEHQLSLIAGLDGVGEEMIAQFSPALLRRQSPRVMGVRPFTWRAFCARHQELGENEYLRQQTLIFPGFVKGYMKARETDLTGSVFGEKAS